MRTILSGRSPYAVWRGEQWNGFQWLGVPLFTSYSLNAVRDFARGQPNEIKPLGIGRGKRTWLETVPAENSLQIGSKIL